MSKLKYFWNFLYINYSGVKMYNEINEIEQEILEHLTKILNQSGVII